MSRIAANAGRLAALVLALAAPAHGELCGDPDGSGRMTVTDGVVILGAAAGLATPCTVATCDMDGNGGITVSDGVAALRGAAGLDAPADCPEPVEQPACVDLAGQWDVYEEVEITCRVAGEEESGTAEGEGTVTIQQDGCEVSYRVPDVDVTRSGVVDGDTVTFRGPFAFGSDDRLDFSENETTVTGVVDGDRMVLEGTGVAEGTVQGVRFRCTGSSTATFERLASSRAMVESSVGREHFAMRAPDLLGGMIDRFATVAP